MHMPWQVHFRMDKAGNDERGAQDHDETGDDFTDTADDDALVAEGEAELEDGEQTDDELLQSPDQEEDEIEELDEEIAQPRESAKFRYKDEKTGNFDWAKMNKVLGGGDLEKSFKESQATITKFSQENKTLREHVGAVPQLQERAKIANYFDHLVNNNPEVRSAVLKALGGDPAQDQRNQTNQNGVPQGVNPQDPLWPVLQQLQRQNQSFEQRMQREDQFRQQQQQENAFLQGLKGARERFISLVGKEPTEEQLRLVANEMKGTGHLNGSRFVADLFLEEIRNAATQKLMATRSEKKNLPRSASTTRRAPVTQKRVSREESFAEEWSAHMDDND